MPWNVSDIRRRAGRRHVSPGALLQAVAGLPAGSRRTRRGTVLIIIIGALALLSVITVAYVSVGKGDRRNASVVKRDSEVDETARRVADYIATDIIGADVLSLYKSSRAFPDGYQGAISREGWDYPYTPWLATSLMSREDQDYFGFSPVGTLPPNFDPVGGNYDNLQEIPGADPWLASTEPVRINYNVDTTGYNTTDANGQAWRFEENHDWAHLSNIAPDGRFVNLWNLRGHFDAEPGTNFDADGLPQMSMNLTLFDEMGFQMPAGSSITTDFGYAADPEVPAHWDSRQLWLVRPARDVQNSPDAEEYLPYQYADADGDGLYDSRWQMLVDARDPLNVTSILPQQSDYRWFVATRIVDLSSLVNVNTATSITAGTPKPNEDFAIGATPSDVDLVRLLSANDNYHMFGPDFVKGLDIPGDVAAVYPLVANYKDPTKLTEATASQAARLTYGSMLDTIRKNEVPNLDLDHIGVMNPRVRANHYLTYAGYIDDVGLASTGLSFGGGQPPFAYSVGGYFGLSDQYELMTRAGVNDDSINSRLELAMGARVNLPGGRWYSPLRDNWPTSLDLDYVDNDGPNFEGNGLIDADFMGGNDDMLKRAWDVRHLLTTISGARTLSSRTISSDPINFPFNVAQAMNELDVPDVIIDRPLDAATELSFAAGFVQDGDCDGINSMDLADGVDVIQEPDPTLLFRAYSNALAPGLDDTAFDADDAWNNAPNNPFSRTVYAYDPEFALLTAAHMTVNAIDAYDTDLERDQQDPTTLKDFGTRGPSAFTLVLDSTFPTNPTNEYPWPQLRDTDERLAPSPTVLPTFTNGAVNVYGVEAQPFITEVGMITLFTDTHDQATGLVGDRDGDMEYTPPGGGIGGVGESQPVSIDMSWDMVNGYDANDDFVLQVLAVQLTNPFDVPINLSHDESTGFVGGQQFLYYIEYAGKTYKLVELADPQTSTGGIGGGGNAGAIPGAPTEIILAPGESRVFYTFSETYDEADDRLENNLLLDAPEAAIGNEKDYIENQLMKDLSPAGFARPQLTVKNSDANIEMGCDLCPKLIQRFDANTGDWMDPGDFFLGASLNQLNEVRLWRRMIEPNSGESETSNKVENDLLVDRMRYQDLDKQLRRDDHSSPDQNISSTACLDDPTTSPVGPYGDNTGYTIALYASVRRPNDPATSIVPEIDPPNGAIPAWCIERGPGRGDSLNELDQNLDALTKGTFSGNDFAETSYRKFLTQTLSGGVGLGGGQGCECEHDDDAFMESIVLHPNEKRALDFETKDIDEILAATGGNNPKNKSYEELYPQVQLSDQKFESLILNGGDPSKSCDDIRVSHLRLADMLLPLAIGPTFDPFAPGVLAGDVGPGWHTLSEMLCSSLGYDGNSLSGGGGSNLGPFDGLDFRTDRGNLVIDDWVPFYDANLDGELDPNGGDYRYGAGIPVALDILNKFKTTDPRLDSITRPYLGVVNINTAPIEVLRTLPMLSPPEGNDAQLGQPYWWWDPTNNVHDDRSDIASTVEAYRDKAATWPRDENAPSANSALNFAEVTTGSNGNNPLDYFAEDPTDATSRNARTEIKAVRETPGFASVAEVLNARDLAYQGSLGGGGGVYDYPNDIDRLGFASAPNLAFNLEEDGVESTFYRKWTDADMDGQVDENEVILEPDEIKNDYDQRLAIANSLFNTISVRSDYYAVWFVIQGYTRTDVDGLRADEPMLPSVSRRYLMIVDRSNVTRLGDKPRILAIKEVPM